MNNMEIFENSDFGSIRVIDEDGKYLFCGSDVAKALGYKYPKDAVAAHTKGAVKRRTLTNGGEQEMTFITEGDLYRLITHSKLPGAERFEKWVFDEVLPTIRKHGMYVTEPVINDEFIFKATVATLKKEMEERKMLEEANEKRKEIINGLLPKAVYYDVVLMSKNAVPITLIAKEYGMSATRFNRLLHALDIQYKVGGCWVLYNQYADQGFTITHTYFVNEHKSTMHTCWTQKGREFLYYTLSEHGIHPAAEKPY